MAYIPFQIRLDITPQQARLHEVEHDGEPITVRRASKLLANNIARYDASVWLYVCAFVPYYPQKMWQTIDR